LETLPSHRNKNDENEKEKKKKKKSRTTGNIYKARLREINYLR
jgi:hypothetical protein